MSCLHIACSSDAAYLPHSAAMLHSVLAHRGGNDVQIHYLHGVDLPPRLAEPLAEMVEREGGSISFLPIADELVAGLRPLDHLPSALSTWYRIYLPELRPELDRVLYLDIDTIVVDSLEPLWKTDLTGYYLAAVTNVPPPWDLDWPGKLGLPGPHSYFNGGVLLMNLKEWRRDDCTGTLREWALAHYEKIWFADQDALNVVLGSRRLALHPRWNCMNSMFAYHSGRDLFGAEAIEDACRRPGIRHFEGPIINKPWHYLCDHPMREVYFAHRRQTPWPRCRLEGVTPRNVWTRFARGARLRATRLTPG